MGCVGLLYMQLMARGAGEGARLDLIFIRHSISAARCHKEVGAAAVEGEGDSAALTFKIIFIFKHDFYADATAPSLHSITPGNY
jgi:hypothetical protein